MRKVPLLFIPMLCLVLVAGCQRSHDHVRGKAPKGEPRAIIAVKAGDTPAQVALQGALVEKCPVSGCWFRLRDQTGTIKVDVKNAGFVVADIPLETPLTVSGKVDTTGEEPVLEATGIRF